MQDWFVHTSLREKEKKTWDWVFVMISKNNNAIQLNFYPIFT